MIESIFGVGVSSVWLFVIAGILLVCELFVFSYFLLFIGIGVAITGILSLFGLLDSFAMQIISIVICSIVALFALRPILKRFSKSKDTYLENANLQLKIGTKAKVISEGIIECNGTMWKSDTNNAKVGEIVRIIDFKDNIAVVESIKKSELDINSFR